jgi:hypothetical protein
VTPTATHTPTTTPTTCQTTTALGNKSYDNGNTFPNNSEAAGYYIYGDKVTVPGTGTIQAKDVWLFTYYTNNDQPSTIFVGVYGDNGGEPQSLMSGADTTAVVSPDSGIRVPLTAPPGGPLYLAAGTSYWVAVAPYHFAVDVGYNDTTGTTPFYQGDPNGYLSALPMVLNSAPATFVGSVALTFAMQLEYCQ